MPWCGVAANGQGVPACRLAGLGGYEQFISHYPTLLLAARDSDENQWGIALDTSASGNISVGRARSSRRQSESDGAKRVATYPKHITSCTFQRPRERE